MYICHPAEQIKTRGFNQKQWVFEQQRDGDSTNNKEMVYENQ